jgi:predicted helicase
MSWKTVEPNEYGDWISQRNDVFSTFISLDTEKKYDLSCPPFFVTYSLGLASGRDAWVL